MTSYVLCKTGSLAVFKVTARDQGHYKGPSGAFVTYCNISCFFLFLNETICCGPSSEPSHQDGSDEGSLHMFYDELTKIVSNYHQILPLV